MIGRREGGEYERGRGRVDGDMGEQRGETSRCGCSLPLAIQEVCKKKSARRCLKRNMTSAATVQEVEITFGTPAPDDAVRPTATRIRRLLRKTLSPPSTGGKAAAKFLLQPFRIQLGVKHAAGELAAGRRLAASVASAPGGRLDKAACSVIRRGIKAGRRDGVAFLYSLEPIPEAPPRNIGQPVQVLVRDNNVDQALKALKKKMQREGIFREMKLRGHYEKPSEKRAREKAEAVRRARKLARKKLQREGLLPVKAKPAPPGPARAAG